MGFSLEWMINLKKSELNTIELELMNVSTKITDLNAYISENSLFLDKLRNQINNSPISWEINSILRAISDCEQKNIKLEKDLSFLKQEEAMILSRYNQKNIEIKLLNKTKENYLERESKRISIKEGKELNDLTLLSKIHDK